MTAHVGNILEAVRERGFYDQRPQIWMLAGEGPDLLCGSGVADVKQGVALGFNQEGNGGNDMADPDCCNDVFPDPGCFALAQRAKSQHRNALGGAGDARKVWPHLIVKKGLGQSVNDPTYAPDVDGNFAFAVEIIGQSAKRHHVIQMDVSDQYIPDFLLCPEIQSRSGAAGINEQRILDQKRGELITGKLPSRAS